LSTWNIRAALKWAHETLLSEGISEARITAEMLLAHVLDMDRFKLYLKPDDMLNDSQSNQFRHQVDQRCKGTPVQHLIGHVSFMGHELRVDHTVLIPRFETEELVEQTLTRLPDDVALNFLDAGTGSGAIAIALLKARPNLQGVALDQSETALETAQKNASLNGIIDRLTFKCSDWLKEIDTSFDLIISNPPYIRSADIDTLAPEVRDHDPRQALDGGPDGLDAIRILSQQATSHLRSGGWFLLEIGHDQSTEVVAILEKLGFKAVTVYPDLAKLDRMVEARWEG